MTDIQVMARLILGVYTDCSECSYLAHFEDGKWTMYYRDGLKLTEGNERQISLYCRRGGAIPEGCAVKKLIG